MASPLELANVKRSDGSLVGIFRSFLLLEFIIVYASSDILRRGDTIKYPSRTSGYLISELFYRRTWISEFGPYYEIAYELVSQGRGSSAPTPGHKGTADASDCMIQAGAAFGRLATSA